MTLYLSGASAYCAFLLFTKFSDQECSKTDPASWIVVALASALWIVVIPISLMEIRAKAQAKVQQEAINQQTDSVEKLPELDSNTLAQLKT